VNTNFSSKGKEKNKGELSRKFTFKNSLKSLQTESSKFFRPKYVLENSRDFGI